MWQNLQFLPVFKLKIITIVFVVAVSFVTRDVEMITERVVMIVESCYVTVNNKNLFDKSACTFFKLLSTCFIVMQNITVRLGHILGPNAS